MRRIGPVAASALLIVFCAGCATALYAGQHGPGPGREALGTPDAVFEAWEQHWTLNGDGSIICHEKQHVRLNSDRVFRAFGNPRIAYNAQTDKVEVLVARTKLTDGTYVELADYSAVDVAPDAAAGWPAFGSVRQKVLVMGGIEPGCVVELEYKVTTASGVRPCLAADVRIDDQYPVRSHIVTVTLPRGKELSTIESGLPEDRRTYTFEQSADGSAKHQWVFAALEARPNEPQALPWRERGVRVCFTTAPDGDTWITQRLAEIDAAADESPLLSKLGQEWTKDESGERDKLVALQKKLAGSFNFVDFDVAWRPATPRRASEVLQGNYGLPAEAAAVLLALARSVGIAVQPALLVADGVWDDRAPQAAMIAEYVVTHEGPDGLQIWHPQHGRIQRDRRWAGYTLLVARGSEIEREVLPAWTSPEQSRCAITGNVTIADDGKYSGKLSVSTAGLFVSPNDLETGGGQKSRVKSIVDHLLPDAKVTNFTLKSLTPEAFAAEVEVESSEPLEKLHESYQFLLSQTSPALADVSLPLAYSRRLSPARLVGAFDERIELTITWPEAWNVEAVPAGLEQAAGPWGSVMQTVNRVERGLKLVRHTRVERRDLTPADVLALRPPLNQLQSDYARMLLLRP